MVGGNSKPAMSTTQSLIDQLERALAAGTNAQRITMLSRVTDLFIEGAGRYTTGQINLFDEVIVKLVTAIEAKARAKLSSRLAPLHNAPSGVVREVMNGASTTAIMSGCGNARMYSKARLVHGKSAGKRSLTSVLMAKWRFA